MTFEQRLPAGPAQAVRQWTDELRRTPLESVLRMVDAQPDNHDRAKWHTAQGVLSVNGTKFFNWNQNRGGGGAIDLAMHLNAMDFKSAVLWLAQRFASPNIPLRATTHKHTSQGPPLPTMPSLILPLPVEANLDRVIRYLVDHRHLPSTLLDPLIQTNRLYADHMANAVFLLLGKESRAVGAELRGTTASIWRGLAPGSRKDSGYFFVGPAQSQEVVLCESAIDAISCAVLYPDRLCISTAGARPNPAWLASLLTQGYRLHCGFDADSTGDHMAKAMIDLHPTIQRLRPPRHDWNDVLTATT